MGPVGICAIFKDEAQYLLEWIAYHLCIGFDHIVLFDNGSTDGGPALVAASSFRPFVTIINWPERPGQLSAYRYFNVHLAKCFEWVAFIDIDEFVHLVEYDSIKVVLPRYGGASGVQLQWLTFASSGHVARPSGLVIENYFLRLPAHHMRCCWVKPLLRTSDIVDVRDGPHAMDVSGILLNSLGMPVPPFAGLPPCHGPIVINHYYTRSEEDWRAKMRRGVVVRSEVDDWYVMDEFDRHNRDATVRDDRIMRFIPLVKRELTAGDPNQIQAVRLGSTASVHQDWKWPYVLHPNQTTVQAIATIRADTEMPCKTRDI
jgi:hypothetical protein